MEEDAPPMTLRTLWRRIFPRYRRLELRAFTYCEADYLLRLTAPLPEPEQWRLAPEEDHNLRFNYVLLERRERIT